jgi:hypothetical protein
VHHKIADSAPNSSEISGELRSSAYRDPPKRMTSGFMYNCTDQTGTKSVVLVPVEVPAFNMFLSGHGKVAGAVAAYPGLKLWQKVYIAVLGAIVGTAMILDIYYALRLLI